MSTADHLADEVMHLRELLVGATERLRAAGFEHETLTGQIELVLERAQMAELLHRNAGQMRDQITELEQKLEAATH